MSGGQDMMGRLTAGQAIDEVVPADHVVRRIDAVLDLGWIHKELAPFYSNTGPLDRPGTDDQNAAGRLRVCDPVGAADDDQGIAKPSPSVTTNSLCRLAT